MASHNNYSIHTYKKPPTNHQCHHTQAGQLLQLYLCAQTHASTANMNQSLSFSPPLPSLSPSLSLPPLPLELLLSFLPLLSLRHTHLSCHNDRLSSFVTFPDHHLLSNEHLLCRDLYAQVTSSHHDTITSINDGVNVLDSFFVLNLCLCVCVWGGFTIMWTGGFREGKREYLKGALSLSLSSKQPTFEMIQMCFPFSPSSFFMSSTSLALRMKEAKITSTPCSTPKARSFWNGNGNMKKVQITTSDAKGQKTSWW